MSQAPPEPGENFDMYVRQQQIIIELLENHHGAPVEQLERALRNRLADHGLPCPPDAWVNTVATGIANDRLYVVANGVVPQDFFNNPAAGRARERLRVPGHDEISDGPSDAAEAQPGEPPGNQIV